MRDWKQYVREHLPPLGLSGAREAEIVEEIAQQLEDAYSDALARGAGPADAGAQAAAQIPDWSALAAEIKLSEQPMAETISASVPEKWRAALREENVRNQKGGNMFADFIQDMRYALRMLAKSPGLTSVIILTLALGIGANSAIFSVVNSVLLRPLPYREPSRLVWVGDYLSEQRQSIVSAADYFALSDHASAFESLTAISGGGDFTLTGYGEAERITGVRATYTLLRTLGVSPQLGRDIAPEEDIRGGPHVVILTDALWRRKFSADPKILGRTITLDGNAYSVIGVLPAGFRFPNNRTGQMLVPAMRSRLDVGMFVTLIGRLKPGVTPQAAASETDAMLHSFHAALPALVPGVISGFHWEHAQAQVVELQSRIVRNARKPLLILLGAVGFVLLIACVNVANLQLARATAREKEIAVRGALGASRWRLARQLFTESALTGLAGGIAGIGFGVWLVALVRHFGPKDIPYLDTATLDSRVLLFTVAVSLLTGILFGLAPVISAFRVSVGNSLKQASTQSSGGRGVVRSQQALMTIELAMTLVLLVGAGLLVKTFERIIAIPPGFDPHNVLTAQISLPATTYAKEEQWREFYSQVLERLQALPGVSSAGIGAALPGMRYMTGALQVEGRPEVSPVGHSFVGGSSVNIVSPGFFSALRIPLKSGRFLNQSDGATTPNVAVVNEAFARAFFRNENPIGHRIEFGAGSTWKTIVGVVGDTRQAGPMEEIPPEAYVPAEQTSDSFMNLVIRTSGAPTALIPNLRAVASRIDPNVAVYGIATMDEIMANDVATEQFNMALLVAFAGLALLLAAVGIYGVMAYAVGQRRQEIGIRMAIGAQRGDVLRMILAQGGRLAILGLVLGVGATFALTRVLLSLLSEVTPTDPVTFTLAALVLLCVALMACWIPARRATKVDPLVALRYE
jgi:putative ABC transport system permease protein